MALYMISNLPNGNIIHFETLGTGAVNAVDKLVAILEENECLTSDLMIEKITPISL